MLRAVIYLGDTRADDATREVVLDESKDIETFRQDCHDLLDRLVDDFLEEVDDD